MSPFEKLVYWSRPVSKRFLIGPEHLCGNSVRIVEGSVKSGVLEIVTVSPITLVVLTLVSFFSAHVATFPFLSGIHIVVW